MIRMSWPESSSAVPDLEIDVGKSCANEDFELFQMFVLYLMALAYFDTDVGWVSCHV